MDHSMSGNKDGSGGGKEKKREQIGGQIKTEGRKEMMNAVSVYARGPWEWQLWQQNKFKC